MPFDIQVVPAKCFSITLEIDNLSWSTLLRLSSSLPSLRFLKIFEVSEYTRNQLFRLIPALQTVTSGDVSFTRNKCDTVRKEMDPLWRLPLNVHHLMFQHLDTDELEGASVVSSKWHNCLHENSKFMATINLKLNRYAIIKYPLTSSRFYENLELNCERDLSILTKSLTIVRTFSHNLIELELLNVTAVKDKSYGTFVFPKLRILHMHAVDEPICKMIFDNLTTLRSLTMKRIVVHAEYGQRIAKQTGLEKVVAKDCMLGTFKECPSHIEFDFEHLKHLEVSYDHVNSWKTDTLPGYTFFLSKFPLDKIKRFRLSGIRFKDINPQLRLMKNLSKLEIGSIWQSDLKNLEILETYGPLDIYVPNVEYINAIDWRRTFPSLQTIRVGSMFNKKR
jgi:hypothetical protein